MADITMCTYLGCPLRDKCRRATAQPGEYQSYMTNPSKIVNGKFECDMFWGDAADLLLEQLKSIMNVKKAKTTNRDTKPVKSVANSGRKNRDNRKNR